MNLIITDALETRASDMHIEPFENGLRVRYRVDGVLHEVESPPKQLSAPIISRIKIMAKLDIAERRLPQDGRIQLRVRARRSTCASRPCRRARREGGDAAPRQGRLALDSTSSASTPRRSRASCSTPQPNGIVLVTGPTGSGKTTTLYAALDELNTPDVKILTVEDPVEYQMPGINQMQVKPKIGLTFATALRSILRQDPDVIMIGEIRDLETAEIAVQAALTGHLVLSTLHTNDAPATVTRLIDMGVEDYLLTSSVHGILAQRLVRTLCPLCREPTRRSPKSWRSSIYAVRVTAIVRHRRLRELGAHRLPRSQGYHGGACS